MDKPICYNCRYRGPVPNSTHSRCHHPGVQDIMSKSTALLRLMEGIVNEQRIPYFYPDLKVVFGEEGLKEGWASWPFNFDPLWLEECSGHKEVL